MVKRKAKGILVFSLLVLIIIVAINVFDAKQQRNEQQAEQEEKEQTAEIITDTENLDDAQAISEEEVRAWAGEYTFFESDTTPAGAPMMMDFCIEIYNDGYADISVNGQTTCVEIRAKVSGNREEIKLIFEECLPEDMMGEDYWNGSDVLVSFRKDGDNIYTYWGALEAVVLLDSDRISGEIYFTKRAEGNT